MPRHAMTEFMTANWAQTTRRGMFFFLKIIYSLFQLIYSFIYNTKTARYNGGNSVNDIQMTGMFLLTYIYLLQVHI